MRSAPLTVARTASRRWTSAPNCRICLPWVCEEHTAIQQTATYTPHVLAYIHTTCARLHTHHVCSTVLCSRSCSRFATLCEGMYNGCVVLYDVREKQGKPFMESFHATGKVSCCPHSLCFTFRLKVVLVWRVGFGWFGVLGLGGLVCSLFLLRRGCTALRSGVGGQVGAKGAVRRRTETELHIRGWECISVVFSLCLSLSRSLSLSLSLPLGEGGEIGRSSTSFRGPQNCGCTRVCLF